MGSVDITIVELGGVLLSFIIIAFIARFQAYRAGRKMITSLLIYVEVLFFWLAYSYLQGWSFERAWTEIGSFILISLYLLITFEYLSFNKIRGEYYSAIHLFLGMIILNNLLNSIELLYLTINVNANLSDNEKITFYISTLSFFSIVLCSIMVHYSCFLFSIFITKRKLFISLYLLYLVVYSTLYAIIEFLVSFLEGSQLYDIDVIYKVIFQSLILSIIFIYYVKGSKYTAKVFV